VKKASRDIDDFCEETGRTRRRDREATPINAKFPPKKSYDPKEFPHDERDRINDWFKNGGDDNPPPRPTNIHLGPDNIPPQGQAQIPIDAGNDTAEIPPADAYKSGNTHDGNGGGKKSYYKSFKGVDDVPDDQAEIVNARFRELDKKYHAKVEHIGTTLGEEQRRYDIQLENRIQYEMEQNPRMRRKTAEKKAIELLGERPSAHGKGWLERTTLGGEYWPESPMYGNESLLTLNPNSLYDARDISEDIAKRKRRIERNTVRISEGKKPLGFSNVSGSFEGTFIHEYGHAIDFTYGIAENDVFKAFYSSLTDEQRAISTYALTNEREFIAEAFAESFMGETQGEVSKQFMKIMEGIVSGKP
jgi:hypothetical protein